MKFILDDISKKIGELIEQGPTKDIKNNIKSLLNSAFSKLNITTTEEFELQQNIILDLNDRVNKLEERLDTLLERTNMLLDNIDDKNKD